MNLKVLYLWHLSKFYNTINPFNNAIQHKTIFCMQCENDKMMYNIYIYIYITQMLSSRQRHMSAHYRIYSSSRKYVSA